MEHYLASARKYRPQKFEDVVGQSAITRTLENAIKSSHLAQAFLFTGPRGVGKTTCARILAKVINTAEGEEIDPKEDFSFNIFELDAASNNSVDDIRSLTEQVRIPPQVGSYKVYIIDEAHMLSQSAFNAFLKTLEEPPPHAVFILATTEKHKIIPTILSRCQIYDFKRIDIRDIVGHLSKISEEEGIKAEVDALHLIAEKADGALRDALSIFDQVVSFAGKEISYKQVSENLNVLDYEFYFQVADAIRKQAIPEALLIFDDVLQNGFDGHLFINGLGSHFRNLLVCKEEQTLKLLEVSENAKARYSEQAGKFPFEQIVLALRLISKCDVEFKTSKNQRLLVEICLMQLCSIGTDEKKKLNDLKVAILPPMSFEDAPLNVPSVPKPTSSPAQPVPSAVEVKLEKEEEVAPVVHELKDETEEETAVPEVAAKAFEVKQETIEELSRKMKGRSSQSSRTISISNVFTKQEAEEEQAEDLSNKPREAFAFQQLKEYWDEYVEELEKMGKHSFAVSMKKYAPRLEGEQILMVLDNKAQEGAFHNEKQDILNHLRTKLNHYGLYLDFTLEVEEVEKKYYTNSEKFERMAEKKPILLEFKRRLNLDTDF
jgi:DNA polymerase-3 subunit gamma/tau